MRNLLLTLALSLSAGAAMADPNITDHEWQLLKLDGTLVNFTASFAIDPAGRVTGKAPCNRYFGNNQQSLPLLSLDALGSTRMACPDLAAEDSYLKALTAVTTAQIEDGCLALRDDDAVRMVFVRDPQADAPTCAE